MSPAERAARLLLGLGRRAYSLLSPAARRDVEDRVFRAVFHGTRITNDAYGWRPPARRSAGPDDR